MQSTLFLFEADFANSLRCIPMALRLKLDIAGVKLKLKTWGKMDHAVRQTFLDTPCETEAEIQVFRARLIAMERTVTEEVSSLFDPSPWPVWENLDAIPPTVLEKLPSLACIIPLNAWRGLNSLQRFALLKLSQSGHEGKNFVLALREFGLLT